MTLALKTIKMLNEENR